MYDQLHAPVHKCGIGGAVNTPTPFHDLFEMAISTQNRGYDGCGFSLYNSSIKTYRSPGKVINAFLNSLEEAGRASIHADRGIFSNRYRTTGDMNEHNLQPMEVDGYVIVHNGNVFNAAELAKRYGIGLNGADSDTKVIGEIIRRAGDIESGIRQVADEALGAYNLVIMNKDGVVAAYRDPWGYHPLFKGVKDKSVYFGSEEPALFALGIYNTEELKPGDLWITDGVRTDKKSVRPAFANGGKRTPIPIVESVCPFELSYFMRPGGSFNGILVPHFREAVGARHAERDRFPNDGDHIAIPIHNSGRHYAIGYSRASGIPIENGFLGNTDMSRLYMEEDKLEILGLTPQQMAALKNMPVPAIVRGKKIVVNDDSIVRAGTLPRLMENLFEAGASEIHLRIGTPPIMSACHMGMNHSNAEKLRANKVVTNAKNAILEEIEEKVRMSLDPRLTSLHYLPMKDYKELLNDHYNHCFGCFTGRYPFPLEELY